MSKTRSTRSILVVEDEILLAMMLEDLLLDGGYHVIRANTLQDAHDAVERLPIDVAILDVNLGGAEVFPLAARLRELRIPFVFASAGDATRIGAQFGDYPIIAKPYTIEQIQKFLSAALAAPRPAVH